MIRNVVTLAALTCTSVMLTACGGPSDLAEGLSEEAPATDVAQPAVVLDTVNTGSSTVRFERLGSGEESPIIVTEEAPANTTGFVVERLVEAHSSLTSLEMFLSLAAEDQLPSESLVNAHSREALDLGRSDESIRRVEFDVDGIVAKSTGACYDFLVAGGESWTVSSSPNLTTTPRAITAAHETRPIRTALCIDGTYNIFSQVAWHFGGSQGLTEFYQSAGTKKSWFYNQSGQSKVLTLAAQTRSLGTGVYHLFAGVRQN